MHWPAALARTAHGRRKACGSPITRTCTNQAAGPKRVLGQANTAVADSASTVPEKNSNSAPSDCAQVILFNDLLAVCSHTPADGRLSVLHRISLFGAEVLVALSLPRTAPPALLQRAARLSEAGLCALHDWSSRAPPYPIDLGYSPVTLSSLTGGGAARFGAVGERVCGVQLRAAAVQRSALLAARAIAGSFVRDQAELGGSHPPLH